MPRGSSEAVGQNMGFGPQELIMCFIAIMYGGTFLWVRAEVELMMYSYRHEIISLLMPDVITAYYSHLYP